MSGIDYNFIEYSFIYTTKDSVENEPELVLVRVKQPSSPDAAYRKAAEWFEATYAGANLLSQREHTIAGTVEI